MSQLKKIVKIGILIPTRGNRPEFLNQAILMVKNQTLQPDFLEIIDDDFHSQEIDITRRYYSGCHRLFKNGANLIFCWEDDDWYSKNYIETVFNEWQKYGRLDIFGIGYSIYYHILASKWFKINHVGRASMMSTCFTEKILNAKWPANNYPYTDIELWRSMKGKTFMPPVPVCLGIKHGIGLVGGGAHDGETCGHYSNNDINGEYLKQITGTDFDFYQGVKNKFVKNG